MPASPTPVMDPPASGSLHAATTRALQHAVTSTLRQCSSRASPHPWLTRVRIPTAHATQRRHTRRLKPPASPGCRSRRRFVPQLWRTSRFTECACAAPANPKSASAPQASGIELSMIALRESLTDHRCRTLALPPSFCFNAQAIYLDVHLLLFISLIVFGVITGNLSNFNLSSFFGSQPNHSGRLQKSMLTSSAPLHPEEFSRPTEGASPPPARH